MSVAGTQYVAISSRLRAKAVDLVGDGLEIRLCRVGNRDGRALAKRRAVNLQALGLEWCSGEG